MPIKREDSAGAVRPNTVGPLFAQKMNRSQSGNSQLFGLLAVVVFALAAGAYLFLSPSPKTPDAPLASTPASPEQPAPASGSLESQPSRETAAPAVDSRTELEDWSAPAPGAERIGATVRGKVVNDNGKPVAEAMVTVSERYQAGMLMADFQKAPKFEALTDTKGNYSFTRLPANKEMNIWVYHGDYAPTQGLAFASLPEESQELPPIVLKTGYSLDGRCTDSGGNPLPARIELHRQQSGFQQGTPEEVREEDLALGRLLQTQADEEGHFHFQNIAEGIWTLRAELEGFATAQIRPLLFLENKSVDEQVVVLEDEHHIAGRATDENDQPVAHALVTVSRVQPRPILTEQTYTQEDGSFDVRGLAPGIYGLSVQAEGYTTGHAGRVQADTTTLVVIMQVKAAVSGQVTGPNGKPVTKFSLEVMRTRPGSKQYGKTGSRYEFESADGTYTIPSFDPGTFILLTRAPGLSATYSPSFRIDHEDVVGIDVHMKSGGLLLGQVTDGASGKPVAGALVSLHGNEYNPDEIDSLFGASLGDPNNIPALTATTDKQGYFRLENAYPGDMQVLISHPQYLKELVSTTVIDGGENDLGTLQIYKGGSIFGRAIGKDGQPLVGGTVNLARQDGSAFFHRSITVDAQGRFRFDGLKSGSYEVMAYPPTNESVFLFPPEGDKQSVYVPDGQEIEVELQSSL